MQTTQEVELRLWNEDIQFRQRTIPLLSHSSLYPEYGFYAFVESEQASNSAWHYRWGNPQGRCIGMEDSIAGQQIVPWTECESIEAVIAQLQNHYSPDKTIHLVPDLQQSAAAVLRNAVKLKQAGFAYVVIDIY